MSVFKRFFSSFASVLKFIQDHFKAMIFLLILFLVFMPKDDGLSGKNNLVEIALSGAIMNSDEIVQKIDEASEDKQIKGILFNIDSPGGAVAPSIELAEAIKRAKLNKKVVVYASGTMASGGYYAAIWADEIIANPGSMIGSIGVIMQGYDLSELMQKVGVSTQSVQAGKYKELGALHRAWSDFELDELHKVINDTYDMFVNDVAAARGLDVSKKDEFANAHIFTASEAQKVGLVDAIGVKYDAKKELERLSGVSEPVWNQEDKFDKILKKLSAKMALVLQSYLPAMILK